MDEQTKFILQIVAVPLLLAVGGLVGSIITKRVRSKDSEQDDLANFRRELLEENRQERTRADSLQEKYYNIFVSMNRIEGIVSAYIKLQARYQTSLLERAREQAQMEAERQLNPAPEKKEC